MRIAKYIVCFFLVCGTAHAQFRTKQERVDLPKFEALPGMKLEWVAEQINYNGLPAAIKNFKSRDSVSEVFTSYERKWRTKGFNKVAHSRFGDMKVLGIEDEDIYYTVQARDTADGGSEGTLIVSLTPLEAKGNIETEFPLYPNSELISVIESFDPGLHAETIVSINNSSVSSNFYWLKAELERDGWVHQQFGMPSLDSKSKQLNFQKQRQLCQVSIVGDNPQFSGKTAVIVNWMK